jgi:hypothetical protein
MEEVEKSPENGFRQGNIAAGASNRAGCRAIQ